VILLALVDTSQLESPVSTDDNIVTVICETIKFNNQ